MTMTNLQLGAARLALKTLELDPEFAHKTATLKKFLPPSAIQAIREEEKEANEFNKDCKGGNGMLSAEATAYWHEVKAVIRRGMANQAKNHDRAVEKRISDAAEALAEAFDARVPDYDKPKFLQYDIQRHEETWDDRWSYVEHDPPLLDIQYEHGAEIPHVRNRAQRHVLEGIVASMLTPEERKAARLAQIEQLKLSRMTEGLKDQEAQQAAMRMARRKAQSALRKRMTESEKRADRAARKVSANKSGIGLTTVSLDYVASSDESEEGE